VGSSANLTLIVTVLLKTAESGVGAQVVGILIVLFSGPNPRLQAGKASAVALDTALSHRYRRVSEDVACEIVEHGLFTITPGGAMGDPGLGPNGFGHGVGDRPGGCCKSEVGVAPLRGRFRSSRTQPRRVSGTPVVAVEAGSSPIV